MMVISWNYFVTIVLISALFVVPVLNVAVPKLWLFLAGNVLTQYPWFGLTYISVELVSGKFS